MKKLNMRKCLAVGSLSLTAILSGTSAVLPMMTTPAFAVSPPSANTPSGVANFEQGDASITIHGNEGQSMVGKKFSVYKLFNAENSEGLESINYTYNDEYKLALQTVVGKALSKDVASVTEYDVIDYIQSINKNVVEGAHANQKLEGRYSDFRYFVEDLRNTMVNLGMQGTTVDVTAVDGNGDVTFDGLSYGYYIVDEVTEISGTHAAASLCMVNTANPVADVQIKSDYPSIIKKIHEDDNGVGWNDIADVEIGQTIPYSYDTRVPNINGYHDYYFAFHDKMHEALTFHPDSVFVSIEGDSKTYTLQASEYQILENNAEDTFKIEIQDLKAIVDREFNQMNDDHENVYGQKITVTYNATLNDLAAKGTGRPGFENKVKLEFSNNPDSDGVGKTGETPWDTVVAFTYKLDVTKINNHNKLLRNAKFRLYSDADCTKEVYVKKTEGGYNVINRDSLGGDDHTGGTAPAEAVEMVSNDEGKFIIFGLDQGTYYLKETDSPAGYRELLDPIQLTLTPTFTNDRDNYISGDGATEKILQDFSASAHVKEFYNGAFKESDIDLETDVDEGQANLTVVNQVGSKLPITGSSMTAIMLGAGVVIMTGSLAFWAKHKKKSDVDAE